MIVNKVKNGYIIVYQAAHGLLAGKIASHLSTNLKSIHWLDLQQAIYHHDDHQLNFNEKTFLSENGIPIDFADDEENIRSLLKRMNSIADQAFKKSGFIYLIIVEHLHFLYADKQSQSKMINDFFERQKLVQQRMRTTYKLSKDEVLSEYEILRFCDRLSLILCKDQIPEMGRELEINTSINGKKYYISGEKNNSLSIRPWIFKEEDFHLNIEVRTLQEASFKSETHFKKSLEDTLPTFKEYYFKKL